MNYYYIIFAIAAIIWISLFFVKRKYFGETLISGKPRIPIRGFKLYYSDQSSSYGKKAHIRGKVLESERYGLKGKPDFVFKHWRKDIFIPVELKSGKTGDRQAPFDGDLMQLAAYFLMVEDTFGGKVTEGRLIYKDRMFIIKNSDALSDRLLKTLEEMRVMLKTGEGIPNVSFANCKFCTLKGTVCEYSLDGQ